MLSIWSMSVSGKSHKCPLCITAPSPPDVETFAELSNYIVNVKEREKHPTEKD